jgi:hypothetical protein
LVKGVPRHLSMVDGGGGFGIARKDIGGGREKQVPRAIGRASE